MHAFGVEMGMKDAKGALEENENESAWVKLFLMEVKKRGYYDVQVYHLCIGRSSLRMPFFFIYTFVLPLFLVIIIRNGFFLRKCVHLTYNSLNSFP